MKTAVLALLLAFAAVLAAPAAAYAQPVPSQPPTEARAGGGAPADTAAATPDDADDDLRPGKGTALLFWLIALATLGGAVFVITRRNLISAVMGMVGTFFAIAVLYAMLYAHFLAAIQVLVYAGAIMVLFVFVIMVLNKPEDHPYGVTGILGKVLAGLALAYLLWRLGAVLWDVKPTAPATLAEDYGSTRDLGRNLFTRYVFPFEAVSIVLLVAVVGAITVARPGDKERPDNRPDEPTSETEA
jgi:NADH-quinone oxidoreductase subunit J